jgi:hypothetical protein
MIVPGGVQPASSTIDIDMTARLQGSPGMRVFAHYADRQLIGDAVIEAQLTPPVVKL